MLFIVCALPCEAAPFISHFRLKPWGHSSPFPIYANSSLYLIISGVGKIQAAAAIGYLQGVTGNLSHSAWINVGIAGHASLPLGSSILAHQIIDQANGRRYYPVFVIDRPVKTASVWTVDKPEKEYVNDQAVYDMEASAFWSVASRFTTAELIHCYKVISDNQYSSCSCLKAHQVEDLMKGHVSQISELMKNLDTLRQSLLNLDLPLEEMERFLQRWHFTHTQQIQLRSLLQRWKVCTSKNSLDLWDGELLAQTKSQHVLQYLDKRLRHLTMRDL